MNLYNLKSSDMNITITNDLRNEINNIYRSRIIGLKDMTNIAGEKVITESSIYNEKLTNDGNKKVKVHLTKGIVGYLTRVNKHAVTTKYVNVNFRPEFYHEEFMDIIMDRHYLNNIDLRSTQMIPGDNIKFSYAYALSAALSRSSYWDKVTFIIDNDGNDLELQRRLMYTGITRARKSLTIII
jgi:ATP-dependent exoDNAse (exonuclease V) alpha subunit